METTTEKAAVVYPEGVRFSYLRDSSNNDRVLTIARVCDKESNAVRFGWSVNAPTRWAVEQVSRNQIVHRRLRGDQFSRKVGREKALERMKESPLVAVLEKNEIPLHGVLTFLYKEADRLELPYHVCDIVIDQLGEIPKYYEKPEETPQKLHPSLLDRIMEFLRG